MAIDSASAATAILWLSPLATTISTVRVEAARPPRWIDPCKERPSDAARALFQRAAARYRNNTMELDRVVEFGKRTRLVDERQREAIEGVELGGAYEYARDNQDRRRRRESNGVLLPFPTPTSRKDQRGETVGWIFPDFANMAAAEFASPWFADSARLVMRDGPREGTTIGFCVRGRSGAGVSGDIVFGSDTSIAAIQWRFRVPGLRALRGGIALFALPAGSTRVDLLPTASVAWSQVPNADRYEVTEYAFGQWLADTPGSPSLTEYVARIGSAVSPKP